MTEREDCCDPSDPAGEAPAMVGSKNPERRKINGFLSLATKRQKQLCRATLCCDVTLFKAVHQAVLDTLVVGGIKHSVL